MLNRLLFFLFITACWLSVGAGYAQELYPMRNYDKWGYIDAEGRWIIAPKYQMAMDFHEGYALVKDIYQGGEVWDVIDKKARRLFSQSTMGTAFF